MICLYLATGNLWALNIWRLDPYSIFACYARWAHSTFYQGGYEDRLEEYDFPLYQKLSEEKWAEEENTCNSNYKLETRTHLGVLHSCFSIDEQGTIAFEVGQPYWEFEKGAINLISP